MIPKVIHYCWYGEKKKPKLVRDCIASWKKHLSDYQIIEWNETNSDLSHPFVKEMYKKKKWAFVSDYIRLQKIYEFGGIYLDTDMMVLKNFEEFIDNECFAGAEDADFINVAVIGACAGNQFIRECKEVYDSLIIEKDRNLGEITIPKLVTKKFRDLYSYNYKFDEIIAFEGIKIYPFNFFYPLPFVKKNDINNHKSYIRNETVAIHLWSSSWVEYSEFQYFNNRAYFKGFCKMMQHLYNSREFKYVYFRKIGATIKKSLNN